MKIADPYLDINQNPILGEFTALYSYIRLTNRFILLAQSFGDIVGSRYGWSTVTDATTASTDFVRSPPYTFISLNLFGLSNYRAIYHIVRF